MTRPGRAQPLPRDARRIPVPAVALNQWLAEIDDPAELKVALRVVGLLAAEPIRGSVPPSLGLDDLLDDPALRHAAELGTDAAIRRALAGALRRGTLAAARVGGEARVFLQDDRAAAYLESVGSPLEPSDISGPGDDLPEPFADKTATPSPEPRANIFGLYEKLVGSYGHNTAEQLKAAEEEYPARWIDEAFGIASEQNIHSWGYVRAILRRWLEDGKPKGTPTLTERNRDTRHDHGEPGHDSAPDSRTGYLESYRRRYGRLPWEPDDASDERPV